MEFIKMLQKSKLGMMLYGDNTIWQNGYNVKSLSNQSNSENSQCDYPEISLIVTALFNNLHKLFAYFTPVNHNYDDNRLTTETDKADWKPPIHGQSQRKNITFWSRWAKRPCFLRAMIDSSK